MIVCTIYDCQLVGRNICCSECDMADCANRCKNGPERCRVSREQEAADWVPKRPAPRKLLPKSEVLQLIKTGMTAREIAAQLGCSVSAVYAIAHRAGTSLSAARRKGGYGHG